MRSQRSDLYDEIVVRADEPRSLGCVTTDSRRYGATLGYVSPAAFESTITTSTEQVA
jgi:hypothetical protein